MNIYYNKENDVFKINKTLLILKSNSYFKMPKYNVLDKNMPLSKVYAKSFKESLKYCICHDEYYKSSAANSDLSTEDIFAFYDKFNGKEINLSYNEERDEFKVGTLIIEKSHLNDNHEKYSVYAPITTQDPNTFKTFKRLHTNTFKKCFIWCIENSQNEIKCCGGDQMPEEEAAIISVISKYALDVTNMTKQEADEFAFRCWQLGYVKRIIDENEFREIGKEYLEQYKK